MQPKKFNLAILGFFFLWLLAGLSLAAAQASPRGDFPQDSDPSGRAAPGETLLHEEWMGAYFQGKKFGFAHAQEWEVKTGNKISYRLEGESLIKLKLPDQVQETFMKEISWLDDQLTLQKVYFRQQTNRETMELWGERTAKGLSLTVKAGGQERKEELAASPALLTSGSVGFVLYRRGLETGKHYRLEILIEPLLLVDNRAEVKVKGRETIKFEGQEVETYVLEVKYADYLATYWISVETGATIKKKANEGLLEGFTSKRESKNEALAFDPAMVLSLKELFDWSLIPVNKPIKKPEALKALTLRLSGVPQKDFFIQDERQNWSQVAPAGGGWGAVLTIKVPAFKENESLSLKDAKKGQEEYLKSDPWAPSDHPQIISLAQQIVKGESNAYRAAQKINLWVYKNLGKEYQESFSALDTLKSRKGDCKAHSQLFAALARSQGIPTRLANGLVYQSSWKGFLYHQWPEVWVGRWVALDPALGQEQADATHIKLSQGGQEGAVKIVSLVGKIGLEIVVRNK